ncbi:MAG: hypothetical protein LBS43_11250 [Prevotellaceae bacterium]|jgi:hypothetical protein|nr:hypothetical protein [Prevotellaceae bacterium]
MKVFVNNKEIILFEGAKVKDAVLSFDKKILREISLYEILDKYGNQTGIDGALQEGNVLFINKLEIKNSL